MIKRGFCSDIAPTYKRYDFDSFLFSKLYKFIELINIMINTINSYYVQIT